MYLFKQIVFYLREYFQNSKYFKQINSYLENIKIFMHFFETGLYNRALEYLF